MSATLGMESEKTSLVRDRMLDYLTVLRAQLILLSDT